jgi:hypothetical protein
MEEEKGKQAKSPGKATDAKKPTSDWLQSAIDNIHAENKDDLDVQPTVNKMDFQTTISRSEYQTSNVPTDRILKRSERKMDGTAAQRSQESLRFRFLYSLTGLILGCAISLTGLVLVFHGLNASSPWLGDLFGSPQALSDIGPGIVLFLFGIVLVFITRQKIPQS